MVKSQNLGFFLINYYYVLQRELEYFLYFLFFDRHTTPILTYFSTNRTFTYIIYTLTSILMIFKPREDLFVIF